MKKAIDPAALRGFSEAAGSYARGRPEYPDEILDWLRASVGLRTGKVVVELGAGTGKFTRSLMRTGARVTAIEPVEGMRAYLRATAIGARAMSGSAQSIPVPDASADAVVCAQSFHWFANIAALGEIHRVLKPHGILALVWNIPDDRVLWVAALTRILQPAEANSPCLFSRGEWRRVFPDPRFTVLRSTEFSLRHRGSPQQVIVEWVRSLSFVANLAESERAALLNELQTLIATRPELAGRGTIEFPYRTLAYHCSRVT